MRKLNEIYNLFIVSNTDRKEYIEAFFTTSKLGKYFSDYLVASELNISKSEAIKKIIADNKLVKSIYVGDTIKDLEATKLINIPFIQAKYGFGNDLKTSYYIDSIEELPGVIQRMMFK